jgi:hypothetical protein
VSGNGHIGTVVGATLAEDRFGNQDSAYVFDGANAYIDVGNISSFSLDTGDFTLLFSLDGQIRFEFDHGTFFTTAPHNDGY